MSLTSAIPPFLASKTRAKVLDTLNQKEGFLYLKGDVLHERHNTDVELSFRQESNFMYLSGVTAPGFHLIVDLSTRRSTLLAPVISADEIMWNGPGETLDSMRKKYDFDDIRYLSELADVLKGSKKTGASTSFVLPGEAADAVVKAGGRVVESKELLKAITEARVTKFDFELERMRVANRISSKAHISLMNAIRPGQNERELHALFNYETHRLGCPLQAYGPIVGSGKNAATLHYGANGATVVDGLCLVDAGAELECYAADITRTYPANGKFSQEGQIVYEIVLAMQKAVFAAIKPGVPYENLHRLSQKVCAQGLLAANIIKGDLDEIMQAHVSAVFYPHGLGHLIGLDVHDAGGYPEGVKRIDEPGIRYLRLRRNLEVGMVITVEPGCYFNDTLVENAIADPVVSKFLNLPVLEKYRDIGGVRIEDCVVVTETGFENLTEVPKEVDDVLAALRQQKE